MKAKTNNSTVFPAIRAAAAWVPLVVARAFWLVMLVGHAPALLSVGAKLAQSPTDAALGLKFVFLFVSTLFFCYKLAGYRVFNIHPTPRVLMTFGLIVVLLHTGIILDPTQAAQFAGWTSLFDPVLLLSLGLCAVVAILALTRSIHGACFLDPFTPARPVALEPLWVPVRTAPVSSVSRRGPPSRTSIQG